MLYKTGDLQEITVIELNDDSDLSVQEKLDKLKNNLPDKKINEDCSDGSKN